MAEKQSKMAAPPLPHSPNDDGHPYPLADHLEAVAAWAEALAGRFASASYARCAGLWHDLGKNAPDFQARVGQADPARAGEAHVEDEPNPARVDHSSAGALYGVRGGIRLRSEMIGGTRCTTTEWLDTFIAELNAGGAPVPVALRTPTQRARASGEALEELARVWHPRPKQGR